MHILHSIVFVISLLEIVLILRQTLILRLIYLVLKVNKYLLSVIYNFFESKFGPSHISLLTKVLSLL